MAMLHTFTLLAPLGSSFPPAPPLSSTLVCRIPISTSVMQACGFPSPLQYSGVALGRWLFGSAWVPTSSGSTSVGHPLIPPGLSTRAPSWLLPDMTFIIAPLWVSPRFLTLSSTPWLLPPSSPSWCFPMFSHYFMYFMYYMVIDFILYITHLGWDMQVPLKKKKKKANGF